MDLWNARDADKRISAGYNNFRIDILQHERYKLFEYYFKVS